MRQATSTDWPYGPGKQNIIGEEEEEEEDGNNIEPGTLKVPLTS